MKTAYLGIDLLKPVLDALLREDCLCALQTERGPDTLPEVCRNFPRTWAYQPSGYLERSLTPACEGVLALLWDLPEGLELLSDPLTKEQRRSMTVEEDSLLPFFQPIRRHRVLTFFDYRTLYGTHPLF